MLISCFFFGTFLVNSFPSLMLFESCTTQLFVSWSFSRSFNVALRVLVFQMLISIADEHKVYVMYVF